MNNKRSIEVTVSPRGEIAIEAMAFNGADCEKATAYLEEALGTVGRKTRKPEYHQRERTRHQHQQRLGS